MTRVITTRFEHRTRVLLHLAYERVCTVSCRMAGGKEHAVKCSYNHDHRSGDHWLSQRTFSNQNKIKVGRQGDTDGQTGNVLKIYVH